MAELELAGFNPRNGPIHDHDVVSKDLVRSLHWRQRQSLLNSQSEFINQWEDRLLGYFANGEEVDPKRIEPRVRPVVTEEEAALFRYASLSWTIPVSGGYGRRTRFLVFDDHNDYLIGIFALGDPVYNLTARDSYIGWNAAQRSRRLYNVMDAFVVGALPPYRQLLGGKLVALVTLADETIDTIELKYDGQTTRISKEVKSSRPVLITTTSALGRSSLYNRLRFRDELAFRSVGYSLGYGHFHFSDDLFRALVTFLPEIERPGNTYGKGPNWKIRALRKALTRLDLDDELLRHGIRREVFIAPLARNWKEYLLGQTDRPRRKHHRLSDIASFWRQRWGVPRSRRDESFSHVNQNAMRLSEMIDSKPTDVRAYMAEMDNGHWPQAALPTRNKP